MANEVENLLIDAQRLLNERSLSHRTTITDVMSKTDAAIVTYIERLNEIIAARHKLDAEQIAAFEQFRDALMHEQSTLVLLRDQHPVLLEDKGPQKKVIQGGKS